MQDELSTLRDTLALELTKIIVDRAVAQQIQLSDIAAHVLPFIYGLADAVLSGRGVSRAVIKKDNGAAK